MTGQRLAVLLGIVVASVAPTACTSGSSHTARGPFAARAAEVTSDLATGNFTAVAALLDPTMKAVLKVDRMGNDWRTFVESHGHYVRHGAPTSVMQGQLDVERVPVTLTDAKGEVRVTFHPDGTIAGLYFLNANAPPP